MIRGEPSGQQLNNVKRAFRVVRKPRGRRASRGCTRTIFCQTWAQTALRKGAERAIVQDAMGWSSDRMARRYEGCVRREIPAVTMPGYALS